MHMLNEVGALRKSLSTALVSAHKWLVLGVWPHMVHELGGVGNDAMAAAFVLALVDLWATAVALEVFEVVDHKLVWRRNLVRLNRDGGKIEPIASNHSRSGVVPDICEVSRQLLQKWSGENLTKWRLVWTVEKARASCVLIWVDLRVEAKWVAVSVLQFVQYLVHLMPQWTEFWWLVGCH